MKTIKTSISIETIYRHPVLIAYTVIMEAVFKEYKGLSRVNAVVLARGIPITVSGKKVNCVEAVRNFKSLMFLATEDKVPKGNLNVL